MTLKELRISKGLNQGECAEVLGMTTRNYQNYENNPEKSKTAKYNAIYRTLDSYGESYASEPEVRYGYNTSVVLGEALRILAGRVSGFQKRDCFAILKKYFSVDTFGKIAVLYGLRRTGKTTLLFQMINELPIDETAYIKIKTTDNMSMLSKDLDALRESGIKYVFIDEVTLMSDFIGTAAVLSDIFASIGMKIVVSGTDSLGFAITSRDELYDRDIIIHTSFISFAEYSRLLGIQSIDSYIEYGGTLRMENMGFGDPDSSFDDVSFRDDESTRKYIDSSISKNIQHTLKNDRFGENFNQLRELYEKGELTNVINRIVENMNHLFLLSVVESAFKSHDLGSARQLLMHDFPSPSAHVLYDIDEKAVVDRLKKIIDIKERSETSVKITQEHVDKVKKYLFTLDLIAACKERSETRELSERIVFVQSGMRYSIAKALVYSLMNDAYFSSCAESVIERVSEKIFEDVKGRMMEDIVLLETSKAACKDEDVFKFKFDDGAEFDMIIYNKSTGTCKLFEIKHSDKKDSRQRRFLQDESRISFIKRKFGNIDGLSVIYRGKDGETEGVKYLNVEKYLKNLYNK